MKNRSQLLSHFILDTLSESDRKRRPRLSKDSVDDQIDSILLKYESDCIIAIGPDEVTETRLIEAGDDKQPELGDPDEENDEEVAAQTGDKDGPDEESDPLQPKIDLKMFCGKVSRLATNYDALLDMPIAIVNRAKNYLKLNYSQALADEFAEIMERDFDINLMHDDPSEPRERPMATGAAATGLGG